MKGVTDDSVCWCVGVDVFVLGRDFNAVNCLHNKNNKLMNFQNKRQKYVKINLAYCCALLANIYISTEEKKGPP